MVDFEDIRVGRIKALRPNPPKNAHMLIPLNKGGFASLNPPYSIMVFGYLTLVVFSFSLRSLRLCTRIRLCSSHQDVKNAKGLFFQTFNNSLTYFIYQSQPTERQECYHDHNHTQSRNDIIRTICHKSKCTYGKCIMSGRINHHGNTDIP